MTIHSNNEKQRQIHVSVDMEYVMKNVWYIVHNDTSKIMMVIIRMNVSSIMHEISVSIVILLNSPMAPVHETSIRHLVSENPHDHSQSLRRCLYKISYWLLLDSSGQSWWSHSSWWVGSMWCDDLTSQAPEISKLIWKNYWSDSSWLSHHTPSSKSSNISREDRSSFSWGYTKSNLIIHWKSYMK